MQHVDRFRESHCVNGAIGVAAMILHNLEYPWAFALPWLSRGVLSAELRDAERRAQTILYLIRKPEQILFRRAGPEKWPFTLGVLLSSQYNIPILGY
jgi:hypothetical protein